MAFLGPRVLVITGLGLGRPLCLRLTHLWGRGRSHARPARGRPGVCPARSGPGRACALFLAQDPRPRGGRGRAVTSPPPEATARPGPAPWAPRDQGSDWGTARGPEGAWSGLSPSGVFPGPRLRWPDMCDPGSPTVSGSFCFSKLSFISHPREPGAGVLLPAAPSPPCPVPVQPAPGGSLPTEAYFCLRVLNDNDKQR